MLGRNKAKGVDALDDRLLRLPGVWPLVRNQFHDHLVDFVKKNRLP